MFLGMTLIMAVYVPDSDNSLKNYEEFMETVKQILRGGRRCDARRFFVAGDLNIELGLCLATKRVRSPLTCMDHSVGKASKRIPAASRH